MSNTSFHIAARYLISKKGSSAVTFITWLAAFAMMTAVAAMFIIISVFSGLEDLNKEMIANLHADLTISSKTKKKLKNTAEVEKILKQNSDIESYSKVIEEKVYINYNGVGEIAYLRAVDSAYTKVNPIDKNIFFGKYPSFEYTNEAIIENSLDSRLSIPIGDDTAPVVLFMPKAGTGIINNESDIFNRKEVFITGVFPGNDQLNNYIIAPLELGQNLLNLPQNSAYSIVLKLKNPLLTDNIKEELLQKIGSEYIIKTKAEENAAFWKMINTEKLMIYLIFGLVIFITTFNLAGAIIILQLDKKKQAKSLISLGLSLKKLRQIYFFTGILITSFGLISGLAVGTIISYFQIQTNIFQAGIGLPFPVKITLQNYFIVASVTLLFGISVSWAFSKFNRKNIS